MILQYFFLFFNVPLKIIEIIIFPLIASVFLNSQATWNLPIRLLSVISRTLVGGFLPLGREAIGVFYSPSRLGK